MMRDHRSNEKRQDALIALIRARAAAPFTPPAGAEGDLLVFHAGQWQSVISPGPLGTVLTSTGSASVPTYQALGRQVVPYTDIWWDPSDSTGTASDANPLPGTALLPLLTTAKVNTLLYQGQLVADLTLHEMSPDPGSVGLDFGTLAQGSSNLFVVGTPQVLHVGGMLDAGTLAINPATAGGGQRQTLHTTDVGDWGPFVFTGRGGASSFPAYLLDTQAGPRLNHFGWIVSGAGTATASASRPSDSAVSVAGPLNIGDSYRIATGSRLNLASVNMPTSDGGLVFFSDIAFDSSNFGNIQGLLFAVYTRCSFNGASLSPGVYQGCFVGNGILQGAVAGAIGLSAGVFVTSGTAEIISPLNLDSDVYVTGTALFLSPSQYSALFIFPGFGAGIQVQDMTGPNAIEALGSADLGGVTQAALIWGNGNNGFGIGISPGATLGVSSAGPTTPTVTGLSGDFAFSNRTVARAWNDAAGAYTEAGGPATRTTTWAHFAAAIGAGGFGFQAHDVQSNAAIVGT